MGINKAPDTSLNEEEAKLVKKVAALCGVSEEQAHTDLAKAALARRVRRRTGKAPAKVYGIRGRK